MPSARPFALLFSGRSYSAPLSDFFSSAYSVAARKLWPRQACLFSRQAAGATVPVQLRRLRRQSPERRCNGVEFDLLDLRDGVCLRRTLMDKVVRPEEPEGQILPWSVRPFCAAGG